MPLPDIVTLDEMRRLEGIVAEAGKPRLVRTRHYVHDALGCPAHTDNDKVRLSIYVAQRARRKSYTPGRPVFGCNNLGAIGSMTVELLLRGRTGLPYSLGFDMRDEWPRLYARAVDSELAAGLSAEPGIDSKLRNKIFDTLLKMRDHYLVTRADATGTDGSYYLFSDSDKAKIVTL